MGAWIEIVFKLQDGECMSVAPYMGAWIEILRTYLNIGLISVAPYMGAWIEILLAVSTSTSRQCRSLHGSVD